MFSWLRKWRGRYALRKARRHLADGRVEAALAACDLALEMDPLNPEGWRTLHEAQRVEIEDALRRVREAPEDGEKRLALARVYAFDEEYEAAAKQLRAAIRLLQPKKGDAISREILRLRGRVSWGLGYFRRAIEELRRGDEPGFARPHVQYYTGLCHLALGERGKAIALFEELLEKNPWLVRYRLGELLAQREGRAR